MKIFPLRFVPENTRIDFIGKRFIAFAFTAVITLTSIGFIAFHGLNYGIDFKGGILMEIETPGPANLDQLRTRLSGLGLGEVALQGFGRPNDVLIRLEEQPGGDAAQQVAVAKIKGALDDVVQSYRRTEIVGPKVGGELIEDGILAVVLSLLGIWAYVWFRFEWQFAVGALVALIHDVIATIGLFSVTGLSFDLSTIAAVLTVAGYSVNDTVVVFDRVRENLRKYKTMGMIDLFNLSINETLSRTTLTSFTTLLAIGSILLFGGPVLRGFSAAMTFGIFIGTFSSIYVASAITLYLGVRKRISSGEVGKAKDGKDVKETGSTGG